MEFKSNDKVKSKSYTIKKLDVESYEVEKPVGKSWPLKQKPNKLLFL